MVTVGRDDIHYNTPHQHYLKKDEGEERVTHWVALGNFLQNITNFYRTARRQRTVQIRGQKSAKLENKISFNELLPYHAMVRN